MNKIVNQIRQKYAHIHPDWRIEEDVHEEMQQTIPYYRFDIAEIVADGFRFEHHIQKKYQSMMEITEIAHPDGIHVMRGRLHSSSDGFLHIQTNTPFVQFYFACNNNRSYYAHNTLIAALQPEQHQGYIFFPEVNTALWSTLPKDEFIEINIALPVFLSCCPVASPLRKQLEKIMADKKTTALFPPSTSTSLEQSQILQDLMHKPALGIDALPLYIKAKVLHLLALLLDQLDCLTQPPSDLPQIPKGLLPIIHQARDILDEEINNPPTITELSLRLGTNDNYLKKYFKVVHQSTIRNYVNTRRMQIAKDMLQDNEKPINEISRFLGYKSLAHFSAHFKKHYGLAPTRVKKRK